MDIVLIELVLWAGLIFFLWVLKDTLGNMESELDRSAAHRASPGHAGGSTRAERLFEPIGSYDGATIYRYAVIDGKTYEFDYVSATGMNAQLTSRQHCLDPGLVYTEQPAAPGSVTDN